MKRRVIAALLTLTMVFSLTACGGSKSDSSKDSSKKEEKEATVDTVKDPITISFWHDRTSDTDYAWLKESIDEFNKTNKYGITVEEVGQGYLDDVQAALTTQSLLAIHQYWLIYHVTEFLFSHQKAFLPI